MTESEKTNKAESLSDETTAQKSSKTPENSDTHPICQNAKDQEKCEEFVERLEQASDNIEKPQD